MSNITDHLRRIEKARQQSRWDKASQWTLELVIRDAQQAGHSEIAMILQTQKGEVQTPQLRHRLMSSQVAFMSGDVTFETQGDLQHRDCFFAFGNVPNFMKKISGWHVEAFEADLSISNAILEHIKDLLNSPTIDVRIEQPWIRGLASQPIPQGRNAPR